MTNFTQTELNQFVNYVLFFYGEGGIRDKGMTSDDVIKGLDILIQNEDDIYEEFCADSLDREIIGELFDTNFA